MSVSIESFKKLESENQDRLQKLLDERRLKGQSGTSYRVGRGDILELSVHGIPELSLDLEVGADGNVTIPMIGQVNLLGRDLKGVTEALRSALTQYVRDPQPRVRVKEYEAHKVSVMGAVQKPGMYPLQRNDQNLTELLAQAGGRTNQAGSDIYLIPAEWGGCKQGLERLLNRGNSRETISSECAGVTVDGDELLEGSDAHSLLIPIHPGDTIIVPSAGAVHVDGEVRRPSSYPLSARTTVLGAIATAGGFTYSADVHKVEVLRELSEGKKALLTLDLEESTLTKGRDIRLKDGDIVRVPSNRGLFAWRQLVEFFSASFNGVGVNGQVN